MPLSMREFRELAAGIDLRMGQLAAGGIPSSALLFRMTAHLTELQRIWTSTTDEQLATLCREYPGFYRYASLMEDAATAERRKPSRPYDDVPELPDALKLQLSSLLMGGAKLERDYQSVLDAPGGKSRIKQLTDMHGRWRADLAAFDDILKSENIAHRSRDVLMAVLEPLSSRISVLEARPSRADDPSYPPCEASLLTTVHKVWSSGTRRWRAYRRAVCAAPFRVRAIWRSLRSPNSSSIPSMRCSPTYAPKRAHESEMAGQMSR